MWKYSLIRSTAVMLASNSAPIFTKKLSAWDTVIESEIDKPTSPGLNVFREKTAKSDASAVIKLAIFILGNEHMIILKLGKRHYY